tara:strand:+ start:1200 stop:1688 length:489 start_codon:yes stop_codon:yes gene_type:complete
MISRSDITDIITDTLKSVDMYSDDALALMIGTGAVESNYRYLKQVKGPARSFWQVEPATGLDNIENYLKFRPESWWKICMSCHMENHPMDSWSKERMENLLVGNIQFAICMARLKYWRVPKPLPGKDDIEGQAEYWLKHYNAGGKGTVKKYQDAWVAYLDKG